MEQAHRAVGVMRRRNTGEPWALPADEARPSACVKCHRPAYEGGRVWIQGHGQVQRQQRGPPEPGQAPLRQQVACRRYRCRSCGAVMRVLPATAVARKHFSAAAMGLALALWGLCGWSAAQARAAVSHLAGSSGGATGRWRTLTRWARQMARGQVFAQVEAPQGTARQQAARLAQILCGWAPPEARGQELTHQAFAGASQVS